MESMMKTLTIKAKKGLAGPTSPLRAASTVSGAHPATYLDAPHAAASGHARRGSAMSAMTSASALDLLSLIEDQSPRRHLHSTKVVADGAKVPLRIPADQDPNALCPELVKWARDEQGGAGVLGLESGAELRVVADHATLSIAGDGKMIAREGESAYICLQLTEVDFTYLPPGCELSATIRTTDGVIYNTKTWNSDKDRLGKFNEVLILPFTDHATLTIFAKFPAAPKKKRSGLSGLGLTGSLRKKDPLALVGGCDVPIGRATFVFNAPVDFGKRHMRLRLATDAAAAHGLAAVGREAGVSAADVAGEVGVSLGVWTGKTVYARNVARAEHVGYLTVQKVPQGTTKVPAWRRYWAHVDAAAGVLHLYDFEYKESKLHSTLPLSAVVAVRRADPEEYPIPHTFVLQCSAVPTPVTVRSGDGSASTIDLAESHETLVVVEKPATWVCRADNEEDASVWMRAVATSTRMVKTAQVKK